MAAAPERGSLGREGGAGLRRPEDDHRVGLPHQRQAILDWRFEQARDGRTHGPRVGWPSASRPAATSG